MLSDQTYPCIISWSKLTSWTQSKSIEEKITLIEKDFLQLTQMKSIDHNILKEIISFVDSYKQLQSDYKSWLVFIGKQQSYIDKFSKFKRILTQLKIWKSDYMDIDGKESIYFLWAPDKRGRIYQISELTPLSDKIIRRVLTISPKYKFETYKELIFRGISKFYFGGNKTNEEYLLLFDKNIHQWLDLNQFIISQADEQMGFISYILEYKNYLIDSNYETNLMLELDGTSNVYQLMSLLSNDNFLAKQVNVINNESHQPQDLYESVSSELRNHLSLNVTRKSIKKSVMCYAYGLTDYGSLEYIRENSDLTSYSDLITITKGLKQVLETKYKSITLIRMLLETLVNLKCKLNKESDLDSQCVIIENNFIKYRHRILKEKREFIKITNTKLLPEGYKKEFKIRVYLTSLLPVLDIKKMKTSITANYVHSIDAECLLSLLTLILNKDPIILSLNKDNIDWNYFKVFTIHDCFLFPAPLYNLILECYKLVLISLKLNCKIETLFVSNQISIPDNKNWISFKKMQQTNPIKEEDISSSKYILT